MTIACLIYARRFLSRKLYKIPDNEGDIITSEYQASDNETVFSMDMADIPGALESFLPLLLPILLILINTIASAHKVTTGFIEVLIFLGQPIIAVSIGLVVAIFTLGRKIDKAIVLAEMEKGMSSAGIIMLVY